MSTKDLHHIKPRGLLYRGKVRDIYLLGQWPGISPHEEALLFVASDRISAFDVVLPTPIPNKGKVLTQLSAFWFEQTGHIVDNHVIALVDENWLASQTSLAPDLKEWIAPFAGRAMVVKRARRIDVECIVRGYLTGSGWTEYKQSGTLWGQRMPQGLKDGDALPEPLFTPTTKAEEGHDQAMTRQDVADMVGEEMAQKLEKTSLEVYRCARDYSQERGLILADTKMEFGLLDEKLILIDELLTPDSSRFWDMAGYEPGRSLPNFDKQYVRDWLTSQRWNREPPAPELPPDVVERTSRRYLEAHRLLTGRELL